MSPHRQQTGSDMASKLTMAMVGCLPDNVQQVRHVIFESIINFLFNKVNQLMIPYHLAHIYSFILLGKKARLKC